MEFSVSFFNVDGWLRTKMQPVFFLKDLDFSSSYWTLVNPETMSFVVTRVPSEAVRVPVHAIKVKPVGGVADSSLIFSAGVETALKLYAQLSKTADFKGNAYKSHLIVGSECHAVGDYLRAYIGISVETTK